MGKRKIKIEKITEKSKLMVTFSKRRQGLMSKAAELSRISGAQIALIVISPGNKFFTYGHPSADCVINRFLGTEDNVKEHEEILAKDETQRKEMEVLERLLEVEKGKQRRPRCRDDRYSWVLDVDDVAINGLELDELANYKNALEELKNSVEKKVSEVEMEMTSEVNNFSCVVTSFISITVRDKLELKAIKDGSASYAALERKGLELDESRQPQAQDTSASVLSESENVIQDAGSENLRKFDIIMDEIVAVIQWRSGQVLVEQRIMIWHFQLIKFSLGKTIARVAAPFSKLDQLKMGKRKIEIKKITEKSKLMVTFSKRRQGLMSKAAELSRLSGAQIALIVISPGNKIFTYGYPSVDCVVNRFLGAEDNVKENEEIFVKDETQMTEIEVLDRLMEVEKGKERKLCCSGDGHSWVLDVDDAAIKRWELDELVNYKNAMEELKNTVEKRVFEVEMEMTSEHCTAGILGDFVRWVMLNLLETTYLCILFKSAPHWCWNEKSSAIDDFRPFLYAFSYSNIKRLYRTKKAEMKAKVELGAVAVDHDGQTEETMETVQNKESKMRKRRKGGEE
ncbi:Transcription factor, MADS-box [Dillenia turbinata]|uniref:Transcription factor, MADS-box n=1 Tax=Dillenia turbinata TaxID=194707 RepID=A0AAN8VLS3_9MAGN